MAKREIPPVHPGEILKEEFMAGFGLTSAQLAADLKVTEARISAIISGDDPINGDMALRLSRYFHTTPQLWLNLQSLYELQRAEDEVGDEVASLIQPRADLPVNAE